MINVFLKQLEGICHKDQSSISMLANASALLNEHLDNINWVGFYLYNNGKLILGPFQGKVACTEIAIGKGVCGTSFQRKALTNVANVHDFEGHIACDPNTNSEIVIPLIYEGRRFGVLDIDSLEYSRFNGDDEDELEAAAYIISKALANKK